MKRTILCFIIMIIVYLFEYVLSSTSNNSVDWDYRDEGNTLFDWIDEWPECGYNYQSPINIDLIDCDDKDDEPIYLEWSHHTQHYAVRNSGHSLQAIPFQVIHEPGGELSFIQNVLHHTNETTIKLKNPFYNTYKSPINSEYCFDSLHFHWGLDNLHGSEHTLNGKRYPLEVHLVHYSCDFYQSSQAQQAYLKREHNDSLHFDDNHVLSVIGVLFEIDDNEPNPVLDEILNDIIIDGIQEYHAPEQDDESGQNHHLLQLYYSDFDMIGLLPTNKEIIGYRGSLTTPPCYQTVRWIIMKNTMTVSNEQLNRFRSLLQGVNDTIAPNYRPLQNRNHRKIYQCISDIDESYVEKDVIINNGLDDDEIIVINTVRDETWFIIGLIFICLFAVSLCIMIQFVHYYCASKSAEKEHRKANNDNHKNETPKRKKKRRNDNNNYHQVDMTNYSSTRPNTRSENSTYTDEDEEYDDLH